MGLKSFFRTSQDIAYSVGLFLITIVIIISGIIAVILGPIVGFLVLLFGIIFVSVKERNNSNANPPPE